MRLAPTVFAVLAVPALAAADQCLTGSWRGDLAQALPLYQAISAVPVKSVGGTVTLDIGDDGAAEGGIDGFRLEIEQGPAVLVNSSEGVFAMDIAADGTRLSAEMTALDVTTRVHMEASGADPVPLAEVRHRLPDLPDPDMRSTYTCSDATLVLTGSGPAPIPVREWTRE